MNYTIDWFEMGATKAGKTKATVTLKDPNGNTIEKVTIWPDFPGFVDLRPGSQVQGSIQEKKQGNMTWKSLHADSFSVKTKVNRTAEITQAIATKNQGIADAQEKKADGIKTSSTFRDATEMTVRWREERLARGIATSAEEWQEEWKRVRAWLSANWDLPF